MLNLLFIYFSLCIFSKFLMSFLKALQFHERQRFCTFLAQTIHTFLKRSPLKWKFLRLLSARIKFVKFLKSILKRHVDSSPNFVSLFRFMKDYSFVLLYLKQDILFSKGAHLSETFWEFWVLRSKFVKFLKSIFKRQVDSSPKFVTLFSFMKDNSSVLF